MPQCQWEAQILPNKYMLSTDQMSISSKVPNAHVYATESHSTILKKDELTQV